MSAQYFNVQFSFHPLAPIFMVVLDINRTNLVLARHRQFRPISMRFALFHVFKRAFSVPCNDVQLTEILSFLSPSTLENALDDPLSDSSV